MTEHHPTYWEARNVYQRLVDILPLVDKLYFVAEHGEVVNLGRVVRDALSEMFRLQKLAERNDIAGVLDGTHVIVPKGPTDWIVRSARDVLEEEFPHHRGVIERA